MNDLFLVKYCRQKNAVPILKTPFEKMPKFPDNKKESLIHTWGQKTLL